MSYDLYFTAPPSDPREAFNAYFAGRPHFEINGTQAFYTNEDTGVYFSFDLTSSADEDDGEPDPEAPDSWASFNLNLFRPHTFAREAALELEAFVSRFGRRVFDAQSQGMGDGEFSVEGFLAGWKHGNAFARRAFAAQPGGAAVHARAADELARIWSWNYARRQLQNTVSERAFVPRINFFQWEGRLCTATVWADGIPVVLPETDIVIVYRDQLAPRRWFRRQPGLSVVQHRDVLVKLGNVRQETVPLPHYFTDFESTPVDVRAWIEALPLTQGVQGVPMDQVLDEEAVS